MQIDCCLRPAAKGAAIAASVFRDGEPQALLPVHPLSSCPQAEVGEGCASDRTWLIVVSRV